MNKRNYKSKKSIKSLVASLERFSMEYPKDIVNTSMLQKRKVIPHLRAVLKNVVKEPQNYVFRPYYSALYNSVVLLDHFGENIFQDLISLLSLKDNKFEYLLGGGLSDDYLGQLLFKHSMGNLSPLMDIAMDGSFDDYNRTVALKGLAFHLYIMEENRPEILHCFEQIPKIKPIEKESFLINTWARYALSLFSETMSKTIISMINKNMISSDWVNMDTVEMVLAEPEFEFRLHPLVKDFIFAISMDPHTRLSALYEWAGPAGLKEDSKKRLSKISS
jgi:Protein of unknown function (DUF1186)